MQKTLNIFISDELQKSERARLLAEATTDTFFWHPHYEDQTEPPPSDFLKCQICLGNVPPDWIALNPELKWIQLLSIGFGEYLHLNWQQLADRIQLTNIAGFFTEPVAQSMLAGLLALYRGLDQLAVLKEAKQWVGDPLRSGFKTLDGANVVLFGYGAINRRFEELIQPFGCQTVCLSSKTSLDDLDQALPSADVVVSTVPDTPSTQNVFNPSRLELFKKTAIFINFGRGSVIDEAALVHRLHDNRLGGAVIDVTQSEPLSDNHGLWGCPNTIITQHTGGGTDDERLKKIAWFCDNLKRFRQGIPLLGEVDFKRGY